MSDKSDLKRFREVLKGFDTGMLITHDPEGGIRARPMSVAQADDSGDVWFVTSVETGKVDEVKDDDRVGVTMQDSRRYLSITGRAQLVTSRETIEKLWSESWRVWFPDGPKTPNIALIRVRAESAEYWDNSGLEGIKFLINAATAYVKGEKMDPRDAGEHGSVPLRH